LSDRAPFCLAQVEGVLQVLVNSNSEKKRKTKTSTLGVSNAYLLTTTTTTTLQPKQISFKAEAMEDDDSNCDSICTTESGDSLLANEPETATEEEMSMQQSGP
jgi:hypothetical protein